MNKYSFDIAWSQEDEGYIATCPEFPGLSAFGENPTTALAEAEIALLGFIDTYEEQRIPLPKPDVRQAYSGQFRVRVPKSLHGKLAEQAKREGVSLNTLIVSYLSERVGRRQATILGRAEFRTEWSSQGSREMNEPEEIVNLENASQYIA
jgi:predicted RNase H-like HicB family nuclease